MAKKKTTKEMTSVAEPPKPSVRKDWKAAKNLQIGDQLESKTGRILTVTHIETKVHRTIVLFDDDMEIDFDNYNQLEVIRKS